MDGAPLSFTEVIACLCRRVLLVRFVLPDGLHNVGLSRSLVFAGVWSLWRSLVFIERRFLRRSLVFIEQRFLRRSLVLVLVDRRKNLTRDAVMVLFVIVGDHTFDAIVATAVIAVVGVIVTVITAVVGGLCRTCLRFICPTFYGTLRGWDL
jgi:hypothetical protein